MIGDEFIEIDQVKLALFAWITHRHIKYLHILAQMQKKC